MFFSISSATKIILTPASTSVAGVIVDSASEEEGVKGDGSGFVVEQDGMLAVSSSELDIFVGKNDWHDNNSGLDTGCLQN